MTMIKFELVLVPNDMGFPVDLLAWREGFNAENMQYHNDKPVEDTASEPAEHAASDEIDGSEDDNNYEVDDEFEDDSDVSLVEKDRVVDFGNPDRCNPDGDESIIILSSDEENGLTRAIIGNAKMTRAVVKMYAIQEGFTLKKIKNDKYKYTVVCKNDACDWRLHSSCLTDGVTFMIKSVRGVYSMCTRVAENKEATSRWVASVLRAKRIVLETLKSDHAKAYAKLKKYGNVICVMNPGSDVFVAINPSVVSVNPTFFRFYHSVKDEGTPICFMSDRQKRGLAALGKEWLEASNRSENAKAADWMMLEPVEKWARHGFDPNIKSDHITNNMSKCFNSWIKDERDKPVLQRLEHLRRRIMVRYYEKWDDLEKWNDSITPYAREMLDTNEKEARKLQVIHDESSWPDYQYEIIKPPVKRTKVGRPKKNRRRAANEPYALGATFSKRCTTCQEIGHNNRTCPNKVKNFSFTQ
ncbi:hypothetical protein EZV62_001816 [Acer yangbiense]|uniref:Transposase MuDR plant domain-containing protein n=1 Tax=Acer yangbiense TaxID=1000413 RepID=A0A5C7IV85_9ROSI|nr:hypothetical protein EZV62_001816 [Acer yangbiense]